MQTLKKEDLEKEREQLVLQIGHIAFHILQPIATILPNIGRLAYVQQELAKLEAVYKPKIVEEKNAQMDKKETPS